MRPVAYYIIGVHRPRQSERTWPAVRAIPAPGPLERASFSPEPQITYGISPVVVVSFPDLPRATLNCALCCRASGLVASPCQYVRSHASRDALSFFLHDSDAVLLTRCPSLTSTTDPFTEMEKVLLSVATVLLLRGTAANPTANPTAHPTATQCSAFSNSDCPAGQCWTQGEALRQWGGNPILPFACLVDGSDRCVDNPSALPYQSCSNTYEDRVDSYGLNCAGYEAQCGAGRNYCVEVLDEPPTDGTLNAVEDCCICGGGLLSDRISALFPVAQSTVPGDPAPAPVSARVSTTPSKS